MSQGDFNRASGCHNPLRQIIVNTHSPSIVSSLKHDALIPTRPVRKRGVTVAEFCCLDGTWRTTGYSLVINPMPTIGTSGC